MLEFLQLILRARLAEYAVLNGKIRHKSAKNIIIVIGQCPFIPNSKLNLSSRVIQCHVSYVQPIK